MPIGVLTLWQVAIGTKSGDICLYDIASSTLKEAIKAHSSTVWSMHLHPDEKVLVTGGADKDVKFWEFEQKPADSENVCHSRLVVVARCSRIFSSLTARDCCR